MSFGLGDLQTVFLTDFLKKIQCNEAEMQIMLPLNGRDPSCKQFASTSSEHEQRARASSTRTRVCEQFKQRPNICEHIFGIPHVNVSFLIILNQERHCSAKRKLCHYSDFSNTQLRYNLPAWVFFFSESSDDFHADTCICDF